MAAPFILVLTGPTASGKTSLAVALAGLCGGEVVSADSQQVYRGLAVGTAQPTAAERTAVPHHLVGVVEPGEGMDAARFVGLADEAIAGIAARGRLPIVCGGTGLYIRALLHGVADAPARDPAYRAELEALAALEGRPALHARLAAVDPQAAARIQPNDLVRIVRALEMARSGRTQTERFAAHRFREERYPHRILSLDLPRPELHCRIEARVRAMLEGGLLDEARELLLRFPAGLPEKLPIGYADAALLLLGRLDRAEVVRRLEVAHRRYARRQVIWLRREPGVEWIAPPIDPAALARSLRSR